MTKPLNDNAARLLRSMAEKFGAQPSGVCIRGNWVWQYRGYETVGRQVRTLKNAGYGKGTYYSGGKASFDITDAGREWAEANPGPTMDD